MPRRHLGERGASAVEYALIVAAVAALLLPAVIGITRVLDQVFEDSCKSTGQQNGLTSSQVDAEC